MMNTIDLQKEHFHSMIVELVKLGIRQEAIADFLHVSDVTLNHWYKGILIPTRTLDKRYTRLIWFYKRQVSTFSADNEIDELCCSVDNIE